MTAKEPIPICLVAVFIVFCLIFFSFSGTRVQGETTHHAFSEEIDMSKYLSQIDSLFVIHFHPTAQCSCCINVGSFARKGLEQFCAKPYNDSLIIFKEYDIDEDSVTAKRYNIFWSALGLEKFGGRKKEFKEIESVWEFCEDEEKFFLNFKREIDEFIMRSKKGESEDQDTTQDRVKPTDKKPESRYPQKSDGNGGKN